MIEDSFKGWVTKNHLAIEEVDGVDIFKLAEESYFLLKDELETFDEKFHLSVSITEKKLAEEIGVDNYCFEFGSNFYYTPVHTVEDVELNILKYIGKREDNLGLPFSFLGLRGKFELCNGSGPYSDWIKKAEFLGIKALGLVEKNTLAGTLQFQQECKKAGMKFILGETITVMDEEFLKFQAKCYVLDEKGWFNLLYINKIINVDNEGLNFISEDSLLKYGEGLVLVFEPETPLTEQRISDFSDTFDKVFYQFNLSEHFSNQKEINKLTAHKNYVDNFMSILPPIIIEDAFYLDPEYHHIKGILNRVGKLGDEFGSKEQYFKSLEDIYMEYSTLFDKDDLLNDILITGSRNTLWISDNANYEIETGVRHLPKFETGTSETNKDLLLRLLGEGMEVKVSDKGLDYDLYLKRLEMEVDVIERGGVIDYFLILWDIVRWCGEQNILVGVGRGSAAGCLTSYVLHITGLDPIEHGLFFERFLDESRIITSLPDLDLDFESSRRGEVKRYMEEKYGIDYVCSVGTYGTFKLKSSIKDIARQFGSDAKKMNWVVSTISPENNDSFKGLFKEAMEFESLKNYVIEKPYIIETARILLNQPKTNSIHACATLILPKKDQHGRDRNIYNWIPVRSEGGVLISEWEGKQLEDAGFLKEDILGTTQLDKFRSIIDKIKENWDVGIDVNKIDLSDDKIYSLFRQGFASDVFHFGSKGLSNYGKELQPFNLSEMIDMISLYRPGQIEANAHNDYVKLKFGLKEPKYDYMLESVTKDTYGLFIYQEQAMQAVQKLGGFSLVVANTIREAMGKKKMDLIKEYRIKFIDGAIANGCDEVEAEEIWNKLEAFASYSFNLSHAASYTVIGVTCQWFKVNYPVEFWTTAFEFAEDKQLPGYIAEINKMDNPRVSVVPPNVNVSGREFISDKDTGHIYWAVNKIKHVGTVSTDNIIATRESGGDYTSLEDFYNRVDSCVNKRVIEQLIIGGCFDEIHNIGDKLKDRRKLIDKYYKLAKVKKDIQIEKSKYDKFNWFWIAKQKSISGLGHFDFQSIIKSSKLEDRIESYLEPSEILEEHNVSKTVVLCGTIIEKKMRMTKKKEEFCAMLLECNDEQIHVLLWPESWRMYKDEVENSVSDLIIMSGKIHFDGYKKCNVIQSTDKTKVQVY